MPAYEEEFEVVYNGVPLVIRILRNGGQIVYRANLAGGGSLFLTRAKNAEGTLFWTSVPEGKQKQAEEIGKLIQEHIISQQ